MLGAVACEREGMRMSARGMRTSAMMGAAAGQKSRDEGWDEDPIG